MVIYVVMSHPHFSANAAILLRRKPSAAIAQLATNPRTARKQHTMVSQGDPANVLILMAKVIYDD